MAKVVGEVAIDVTADIGPLVRAMKRGKEAMSDLEGAADKTARGLKSFGNTAEKLGKSLSIVSAAMGAALGGAFMLAKGTADTAKEIKTLSNVANTSTDEFQRMAAGAKTVGIEQDKLADILKDVNDRVGDFNATGGGPMADFFENIAPKVGITADAFKDLSGPQALQLYVDSLNKAGLSQADMTFYMEAMASDATALLPLLANNGAEMKRLGDAAAKAGGIMSTKAIAESQRFSTALTNLQIAAQGLRDRFAVTLMPVITRVMELVADKVVPAIETAIDKFGSFADFIGGMPAPILEALGVIGTALGVGGPVLIGIGLVSKAISTLIAATGPVGLFITAASLLGTAWAMWGDDFKSGVGAAIEWVSGKVQGLIDIFQKVVDKATAVKNAIVDAFTAGQTQFQGAGITGRGPSAPLPMDGTGIGADLGAGIIGGLGQSIADRDAELRAYIDQIPQTTRDQLGIHSPSRVFHEIGQFMGLGMANGINESTAMVAQAAASMGQVAARQADASASSVLSAMGQLFQGSKKLSAGIALANSWLAFTEVLKDPSFIGRPWARFAAAASALSSGLNAVNNIKSATVGGGSGTAAATSAPAQVVENRTANINFTGSMMSGTDIAQTILTQLNSLVDDGWKLNVRGA